MNRYQQLADLIKQQIQHDTWRAGERMPSIRVISRSHSVSTGTVLQAYQQLEAQGWIVAKPQSGYFVSAKLDRVEDPKQDALFSYPSLNDRLFEFLKSHNQEPFLKLGSAFPEPNLFPLEALNRSLASAGRRAKPESILAHMPPGSEGLRRAIAQRYIQQGLNISHDDIVITSGALEALNLSMQVVTKPGDTVVIEMPTFYGALQCVERLGLKAIPLALHSNQTSALVQLEQAFSQHNVTACWLMSNFHNPTGQSLSDVSKQKIVESARKHQVHLIEDDVYGELYFAQDKPSSLKSFDNGQQEQVLHCSSLSKSLCPGYRLGWVVSKRFHQPIQKLQMMSTLSGSAPIQLGIAHYLQHGSFDNHLRRLRKTLHQRTQHMADMLRRYMPSSVVFTQPQGGYFLWLKLPDGVSGEKLSQQLAEYEITVASGSLFANNSECDGFVRLNTTFAHLAETEQAIKQMGDLLRLALKEATV